MIGIFKGYKTVYCSVCGCRHRRNVKIAVHNENDIEKSRINISDRLNKKYTCNICKSILKENKEANWSKEFRTGGKRV